MTISLKNKKDGTGATQGCKSPPAAMSKCPGLGGTWSLGCTPAPLPGHLPSLHPPCPGPWTLISHLNCSKWGPAPDEGQGNSNTRRGLGTHVSSNELPLPLGIWKLFPEAQRHLEPWQRPAVVSKGLELCRDRERNRSEGRARPGRRLGRKPRRRGGQSRRERGSRRRGAHACSRGSPEAPPPLQGGRALRGATLLCSLRPTGGEGGRKG